MIVPIRQPTRGVGQDERRPRRVESEERRRRQLVEATIASIADVGFSAATIADIAGRAGVSTGLVAFHFGDKDGLLEATLRHLARELTRSLASRLRDATTPRERVRAVLDATLGASQFDRAVATVWLSFWAQVPHRPRFARIQRAYQARLATNLRHALRPLLPREQAASLAEAIAAMIDGTWLRATLSGETAAAALTRDRVMTFVDSQIALIGLASLDRPGPR